MSALNRVEKAVAARTKAEPVADRMLVSLAAAAISTDQREEWRKRGVSLPDGSYPIPNTDFLRRAMQSFGRAPASKRQQLKRHIMKRAKELGVDISDSAIVSASAAGISTVDYNLMSLAWGNGNGNGFGGGEDDGDDEDEDENDPRTIAVMLDAVTDAATDMIDGIDASSLPGPVAQALALLQAADSLSDDLLEALGIPDPEEIGASARQKAIALAKPFGGKQAPPFKKGGGGSSSSAGDELSDDEQADVDELDPPAQRKYHALRAKGMPHAVALKAVSSG